MGKADLTNLFIEGQKVSLEAVNITVDDRKKYPGWQERVENVEHFWLSSRPALPVQAPSHLGLDKQVPAEKRHRQNCSWICSRQQLVCRYFHSISITRAHLGMVSSSMVVWLSSIQVQNWRAAQGNLSKGYVGDQVPGLATAIFLLCTPSP